MEERGSAILLFFNFWVQYYHSTLSKNHARLFYVLLWTSFIETLVRELSFSRRMLASQFIEERDVIGLLLVPGVQRFTFYSSIARSLQ